VLFRSHRSIVVVHVCWFCCLLLICFVALLFVMLDCRHRLPCRKQVVSKLRAQRCVLNCLTSFSTLMGPLHVLLCQLWRHPAVILLFVKIFSNREIWSSLYPFYPSEKPDSKNSWRKPKNTRFTLLQLEPLVISPSLPWNGFLSCSLLRPSVHPFFIAQIWSFAEIPSVLNCCRFFISINIVSFLVPWCISESQPSRPAIDGRGRANAASLNVEWTSAGRTLSCIYSEIIRWKGYPSFLCHIVEAMFMQMLGLAWRKGGRSLHVWQVWVLGWLIFQQQVEKFLGFRGVPICCGCGCLLFVSGCRSFCC